MIDLLEVGRKSSCQKFIVEVVSVPIWVSHAHKFINVWLNWLHLFFSSHIFVCKQSLQTRSVSLELKGCLWSRYRLSDWERVFCEFWVVVKFISSWKFSKILQCFSWNEIHIAQISVKLFKLVLRLPMREKSFACARLIVKCTRKIVESASFS